MSQSKDFFWLIQAPNISKHISRNGGATIKAVRKTAHNKKKILKGHFSQKWWHHEKHYSPKSVYWYQCFSA